MNVKVLRDVAKLFGGYSPIVKCHKIVAFLWFDSAMAFVLRSHICIFRARGLRHALAGLCLFGTGGMLHAATPDWFAAPYEYVVLDQDIRAALTEFGRNLGVAVSLSDNVKGRINGRIEAGNAGDFLDTLAQANGLTWYHDGAVLHVSTTAEYGTRVISSGRINGAAVTREMQELGLADDRFALRGASDGSMISVSGPPAYIAMVEQFVGNMQPAMAPVGDDPRVRVYRGRIGSEITPVRATETTQP